MDNFERPFLTQSDLSVENGLIRLKPKSDFPTPLKKGFFESIFFYWAFRRGGSDEQLDFCDWIGQSKNSVENVYTCFLNRSHRSPNCKTHTRAHAHTPILGTTQVSYNITDAGMASTVVASRRKSASRTPSSASQQLVSHDGTSARCRLLFANNGCSCCSCGGFRLNE